MKLKFIAISADAGVLYALSADGDVYKYVPSIPGDAHGAPAKRFAFWTKLTNHAPSTA